MKRLLFFFFTVSPFLMTAQLRVGVAGGGYFSNRHQGINAGLIFQQQLGERTALGFNFEYTEKPIALPINENNSTENFVRPKISYLVVPIQYQYYLPVDALRFGLLAGPYFAYGIRPTALEDLGDFRYELKTFDFDQLNMHRFDIGFSVGAGIELELLKNKRMFINFRYVLGLRDLNKTTTIYTANEGISLQMGFMIPFRKMEG